MSPASFARHVKNQAASQNPWFWACTILVVCFVYIRLPSMLARPEMFAEAGQNYFATANQSDWYTNLVSSDAGYWPLNSRLLALVCVKVFGAVDNFPLVTQWASVCLIAMMSAFITSRAFRPLVAPDAARFVLGLLFGCGVISDYSMYSMINFSYFGLFPVFLTVFLDKERMSRGRLAGTSLMACLLILSKGFFIVFGPLFALLTILDSKNRRWRSALFNGSATLAAALQFLYMIKHINPVANSRGLKDALLSPATLLMDVALFYVRAASDLFLSLEPSRDPVGTALFVLTGFALLTAWSFRTGDETLRRFLWTSHLMLFTSSCLWIMVEGLPAYTLNQSIVWQIHRQTFFAHAFMLLAVCVPAIRMFSQPAGQVAFITLIGVMTSQFHGATRDIFESTTASHSQWKLFSALSKDQEYCIPVNPYPWTILHNIELLNSDDKIAVNQSETIELAWFGREADGWDLKAILLDRLQPEVPPFSAMYAIALDERGKELARGRRLTPAINRHQYFLFDRLVNAARVRFCDEQGQPVGIAADVVRLFGRKLPTVIIDSPGGPPQKLSELISGGSVTMPIRTKHAGFSGISVRFSTSGKAAPADLRVNLKDKLSGETLLEQTVPGKHLKKDGYFHFRWLPRLDSCDREYLLSVESPNGTPNNAVTIWASGATSDGSSISANGTRSQGLTLTHKQVFDQRR
jgi:hypothetical protein